MKYCYVFLNKVKFSQIYLIKIIFTNGISKKKLISKQY